MPEPLTRVATNGDEPRPAGSAAVLTGWIRAEQAAHLLLTGIPHCYASGASRRVVVNPSSNGATPPTEDRPGNASPNRPESGRPVPPARQCTPKSPSPTPAMAELSVTTARLKPISHEQLGHCLAGRPPSPQPSRNLTESARNGQSRARTPSRCPERQVIAPATAPGLARLSVAPHHGADYYLSLGTSPPARRSCRPGWWMPRH